MADPTKLPRHRGSSRNSTNQDNPLVLAARNRQTRRARPGRSGSLWCRRAQQTIRAKGREAVPAADCRGVELARRASKPSETIVREGTKVTATIRFLGRKFESISELTE